ncbi:MAG: aldo/keto reductase [Betaproteobacteria bacterium]|nr:aldo/keto reductase [Betaproteobacteria bacterium]
MNKRQLGNSGIAIAPVVFGGNVFGWTVDERTAFTLLDAAVASGINCIDTADLYSRWVPGNTGGDSEIIIGDWLKRRGRRDDVIIATKVGKEMGPGRKGLSRAYIRLAVEDSLRRLCTDYIDLYQSHDDDLDTPLEETLDVYGQLMKEGKIRAIGASNFSAGRLAQALEVSRECGLPRYESLQPKYNLYDRNEYEGSLENLCLEHGVAVISHSALANGFLTGKYRSVADAARSSRSGRVGECMNERGLRILAALDEVAQRYAISPAQVALAWLIARPGITAPIASATSLPQLEHLVGAMELNLDSAAIGKLDQASA